MQVAIYHKKIYKLSLWKENITSNIKKEQNGTRESHFLSNRRWNRNGIDFICIDLVSMYGEIT